jgi:pimeloyl-ACP methyl ester carboxylesterase
MHYVLGGHGPAVVIVHGGLDSWWAWRDVIPGLAQDHTVILPALRGLAMSSKPAGGYEADNVADDVHHLVTQELGIDPFVLVGHDWGGTASYCLAAQFPASVSKLALFDTILPGLGIVEDWLVPKPDGEWLWHFALCTVPDVAEMLIHNNLRPFMQTFFSRTAIPDAIGEESIAHYVSLYSEAGALAAYLKYYQQYWITAEQCKAHMSTRLPMPVLAYGGDAACGELTLNSMRRVANDVRGGVIPHCGHWIAEENPKFVAAALQEFLGQPGREKSPISTGS